MSTVSPLFAQDVNVDLAEGHLSNADLAPVPRERRKCLALRALTGSRASAKVVILSAAKDL